MDTQWTVLIVASALLWAKDVGLDKQIRSRWGDTQEKVTEAYRKAYKPGFLEDEPVVAKEHLQYELKYYSGRLCSDKHGEETVERNILIINAINEVIDTIVL